MESTADVASLSRWELFRLLGEPSRLRLLALAAEEELAIGELAELLRESQPNVSRHVKPLRQAGLLTMRKEGTRVLVRVPESVRADAVVGEALREGRALAVEDGSLDRVATLVREREHAARAYFEAAAIADPTEVPHELSAYLHALGLLLPHRALAVDVGTGDGRLLEALAPLYTKVLAIDRSSAQLALAGRRATHRGFENVELLQAELESPQVEQRVHALGGADAVFASRMLHHAASPPAVVRSLARLLSPHGTLLVLDYAPHADESMRDRVADLWLGFESSELIRVAHEAGLAEAEVRPLPRAFHGDGPDAHLDWQVLVARRGRARR